MKGTFVLAVVASLGATALAAFPAFGTSKEYQVGDDHIVAQIWTYDDYLIVARTADEASKGGFPSKIANSVGRAFLDGHGMKRCTIKNVGLKYNDLPGVYQVGCRC